jgi:hypothetical protein
MSKKTRSARGDLVDFDLLAIKQQLAATPVPVGVNDRRRFIDEKDGFKSRARSAAPTPDALAVAAAAVEQSAAAKQAKKKAPAKVAE